MPAFYIVLLICAVALVAALAPFYRDIGGVLKEWFTDVKNAVREDDDENEDNNKE